ncbi:hypothetical protein BDW75DRAFT_251771 [Aspergillus navahoensis]
MASMVAYQRWLYLLATNDRPKIPAPNSHPTTDVASSALTSGTATTRQPPLYFDASSPSKNFSLAQAEVFAKRIAKGLEVLGLQPNDKVLPYSHNAVFFPVILWGVLAARCVLRPWQGGVRVLLVEYQLRDSDAKIVLAGPEQVAVALGAASRVGIPRDRVYLFCDPDDVSIYLSLLAQSWTRIWRPAEEVRSWSWKRIQTPQEAQETTAIIKYSSGCVTHYNVVANSVQLLAKRATVLNDHNGKSRKERLDMAGDRWLTPLPMYQAYGQAYYCLNAACLGANGSAPLSAELGRMIERLYLHPGVTVKQGWGMTETPCSITGFAPDDEDDGRSIGWLNPNCTARIEKIDGRDFSGVAPDGVDVGEIWVAGPNVMRGYYKNPRATKETIVEEYGARWLKTGDIGHFDRRGYIYIVDRLKVTEIQELIKVKGLQVALAELEQYLLTHPGVADAAVAGARINNAEYPRTSILSDMVKAQFAPHKWLTRGVYFIDQTPRTGSGKIVRRKLPAIEDASRGSFEAVI